MGFTDRLKSHRRAAVIGAAGAGLAAYTARELARYRSDAARGYKLDGVPQPGTDEFARLVEALTAAPLRHGNRLEVLRNGDEIFPAMLTAIRQAKRTVDLQTFVYWTGDPAVEFATALAEKATEGLKVNVLLDAVGANKMDAELVGKMEDAGVKVAWFRPVRIRSIARANNRTHRKILVCDASVGFTGGVGIAQEWTGHAQDPEHWRDTHVRVDGPAGRDLLGGFLENWAEATGEVLTGDRLRHIDPYDDGVDAQVTRSSATKGHTEAEELFFAAIEGAQQRLWLTTAYFAPRRAFVDAIVRAVGRGADVRLLVNGPNIDKQIVRRAGHASYDRLLQHGVRIFEFQPTMLHAKVMVIDRRWATIGSINFDDRSFRLHEELNLSVSDDGCASELAGHFDDDLARAEELTLDAWRARPAHTRAVEKGSALLKRQL
ncbi:MAG: phospholipase D-like domain-containing protein [Actinomycetota bacterium]